MRRYQIYDDKKGSAGDAEDDQPNLQALFVILFIFGFLLSFIPILDPIHRLGQALEGAEVGGLQSWSTGYGGAMEVRGLLTGFKWEFWFASLVTAVVFLLSVRRKDFPWVGVSWGYANGVFLFALVSCEIPLLSRPVGYAMPAFFRTWLTSIVPVLVVGWILVGGGLLQTGAES
jgi:hypothetical protein